MKASFENSVSVLVRAYLNNELQHGDCGACAVGNLVLAAGVPKSASVIEGKVNASWKWAFFTCDGVQSRGDNDKLLGYALWVIKKTGYLVDDLARVEFAFETAEKGNNKDDYMFNGLLAVVDVLAEIHGVDLTVKENAIGQFETVHASK